MTMNTNLSGLDMARTIKWYGQKVATIAGRLPKGAKNKPSATQFTVDGKLDTLNMAQIYGVLQRFPAQARRRMNLRTITVTGPLWFSTDSMPNAPKVTMSVHDAISETAIVPSFVQYTKDTTQWCGYSGHIQLYAIHETAATLAVRKIIHTQALCHELAHCLITPELHGGCTLMFPNETFHTSKLFSDFSKLADRFGPISHYASAYCDKDGKLLEKPDPRLPINEAMAEAITAYLLGFAYQPNSNGLHPFEGARRKELWPLIYNYLHATRMT